MTRNVVDMSQDAAFLLCDCMQSNNVFANCKTLQGSSAAQTANILNVTNAGLREHDLWMSSYLLCWACGLLPFVIGPDIQYDRYAIDTAMYLSLKRWAPVGLAVSFFSVCVCVGACILACTHACMSVCVLPFACVNVCAHMSVRICTEPCQ